MSGGPGGGSPACAGVDYSGMFFSPSSTSTYSPGGTMDIAFYGGSSGGLTTASYYPFSLVLQKWRNSSSITNITNTSAFFGTNNWVVTDVCGNTEITHTYDIPQTLQIDSDPDYVIIAYNTTSDSRAAIATSDTFRIIANETTSSSTETMTTTTNTRTTSTQELSTTIAPDSSTSSPVSSTVPSPSPSTSGLSIGAKIGLAIGIVLGLAFLCVGLWLLRRARKRKHVSSQGPTQIQANANFEKPELDSTAVPNASRGSTHQELVELGS